MSRPMVSDPIGHVTASAQIVDLSKSVEVRRQRLARREWQRYVWGFYRTLPEVRYPANYIGNALSRFTMRPALLDPDSPTADPRVPESKNRPAIIGAAEDILAGLEGPQGGIGEIQRRYGLNMNIAADGYLFAPPTERGRDAEWEFLSTNELRFTEWRGAGERAWRDALGSGDEPTEDDLIPDNAYLRRFWYSHPEYSQQADGPLEALKDDCQRLLDLNDSISGRILSRLASAGILFIPNSISMPITPQPEGSDLADMDPVIATIIDMMQKAIQNRGTAAGVMPIIMRGSDEAGEKIKHITLDRVIDEGEMRLRDELRTTITRGQDLPIEVQTGMGEASHWANWSISDSTVTNHLQPPADRFADGLLRVFLRPALADNGFPQQEIATVTVIADGSNVVTRPNAAEDYRQLHDRITVSDKVLREKSGAEDADAPSEEEYVRILGRQIKSPYLATFGMDVAESFDWEKIEAGKPAGAPGVGGTPSSRLPADSSKPAGAPGDVRK